jgi:amidohydrolase
MIRMATDLDINAALINTVLPHAIDLRHRLHQIPELGYEEVETAKVIRAELDRLGVSYVAGVEDAPTATIGLIGDASNPCIALRADIDALPITEATGLPYASKHPGRMHACGHDGHTANLLATAAVLKQREGALKVCVKLLFQPAEEGGAGASRLVRAGVLDGRIGPKVKAVYGLHGWPGIPVGVISTKPGPLLAATDTFKITFRGKGCHGAFPHLGRDPIVCAAEAVLNLQQWVSRELDPTEPGLITVGKIHAGTAVNIIPDEATIEGTIRTLSPAVRKAARAAVERRCAGLAAAADCGVNMVFNDGYPPTVNDPAATDFVVAIVKDLLGASQFIAAARPVMGGEDFAFYAEQVPACFFMVGVVPAGQTEHPPLHSDRYDFTDAALDSSVRMFVGLAMRST